MAASSPASKTMPDRSVLMGLAPAFSACSSVLKEGQHAGQIQQILS